MKLYFYGAAREVTGSCCMVNVKNKNILIDCGLEQGSDEKNNNMLPFRAADIDAVLVTHAHIDHSGRLPLLVKNGFNGPIYATSATCRLLNIMLLDSAHIQETEAGWKRRKEKRAGLPEDEPLYTTEDARNTLSLLHPVEYRQEVPLFPDAIAVFTDAGHLLGSASITMRLKEAGITRTVVFSGDIGNKDKPIIRDPEYLTEADYVIMESTYGNKAHDRIRYSIGFLADIIDKTLSRGGNVVIPAFAVGRTQELLYQLREIKEQALVKSMPDFTVHVDSPLALEATQIYNGDLTGYADEETLAILKEGFHPLRFPGLKLCRTTEESIALNEDPRPKVIISASGMCDAGRIRHHLKHNLWRKECSIVFSGYQANGTLGRMLLDGLSHVKLFGEDVAVRAEIYNFRGLSSHADRDGLIEWIRSFKTDLQRVFVVHGEEQIALQFVDELSARQFNTTAPQYKASYDLLQNSCIDEGVKPRTLKKQAQNLKSASSTYARLLLAGEKMMNVIQRNEGGANKDLAKFADQLLSLAEKWDR
ncbi:MAG: MBL fold metallo-hydrolase RNA specificity domain-containing protein [Christensenellaceae bacterium]|jgi:metallo-beta-lactamase family protein